MSTTERPGIDSERNAASPGAPFTAASIGRVTSASTWSGVNPGASVWIETCAGTNSGNTSIGVRRARDAPSTRNASASVATTPRRRTDQATSHCMRG